MSTLPDISRFAAFPSASWGELGTRLREIELNGDYVDALSSSGVPEGQAAPILLWHARRRDDPAAYAYRALSLRDPISEHQAAQAFGPALMRDLLDIGLLAQPEAGRVVSQFDLRFFRGLSILCDDLAHGGDAAFGVGPGTGALCRAMPQGELRTVLDVGCGAGAVALWAARLADRVLATDISPRALAFVEINARINEVNTVETRQGDLFEPVGAERFNFIAAQPPFVPDPGLPTPARYRFGGPRGDELAQRIIAAAPTHLEHDGRAIVVFIQPMSTASPEPPMLEHQTQSVSDRRVLLLLGAETEADAFSARYAETESSGGRPFSAAAMHMREHIANRGIRAFCPAVCVIERAEPARGWKEVTSVAGDLWYHVSGALIQRILDALELLHQPVARLVASRLRIPDGALMIEPLDEHGIPSETRYLGLAAERLVRPLELDSAEWMLLQSVHSASNVESALVAQQGPDSLGREAALASICRALRAGLLEVRSGRS